MSEFGGLWFSMETPKVTQCTLKHVRLKSLQTVEVGTTDSTEEEILVCNLKDLVSRLPTCRSHEEFMLFILESSGIIECHPVRIDPSCPVQYIVFASDNVIQTSLGELDVVQVSCTICINICCCFLSV